MTSSHLPPWQRNRPPSQTWPAVAPTSHEAYAQGDILVMRQYDVSARRPAGRPVIAGNLQLPRFPYTSLDNIVARHPHLFPGTHPLHGWASWQQLELLASDSYLPSRSTERGIGGSNTLKPIICRDMTLACILKTSEQSKFVFAEPDGQSLNLRDPSSWTNIENLTAGDMVLLSGGTAFAHSKRMPIVTISGKDCLIGSESFHFTPKELAHTSIDAQTAPQIIRAATVSHDNSAQHRVATTHGMDVHTISLAGDTGNHIDLAVQSGYAVLAAPHGAPMLEVRHSPSDTPHTFSFDCPPVGCIVRGGTTMSLSGIGPVIALMPIGR